MSNDHKIPSKQDIESVINSMIGEQVLACTRMKTGDQNFVFAVSTSDAEYILRMTDFNYKYKFEAALAWQKLLLPVGVPLAKFIKTDLDAKFSLFPSLLMLRLPGDDLINVYHTLTDNEKRNLAIEMINVQALCKGLPNAAGFGILDNYDDPKKFNTWYDFLLDRLDFCKEQISTTGIFDIQFALQVIKIAEALKDNFSTVPPQPFLWDASERNVLVENGKITGIVDVDELCFGDPLLVIALTSTCLELDDFDTKYTDYWESYLVLEESALMRLNFYKLFYAIAFMRKHSLKTANRKQVLFDTDKLTRIFHHSLDRISL